MNKIKKICKLIVVCGALNLLTATYQKIKPMQFKPLTKAAVFLSGTVGFGYLTVMMLKKLRQEKTILSMDQKGIKFRNGRLITWDDLDDIIINRVVSIDVLDKPLARNAYLQILLKEQSKEQDENTENTSDQKDHTTKSEDQSSEQSQHLLDDKSGSASLTKAFMNKLGKFRKFLYLFFVDSQTRIQDTKLSINQRDLEISLGQLKEMIELYAKVGMVSDSLSAISKDKKSVCMDGDTLVVHAFKPSTIKLGCALTASLFSAVAASYFIGTSFIE